MRGKTTWSMDLTSFLWKWVGLPFSLLLTWVGVDALIQGEIRFRGVTSRGITGLIGGLAVTIGGIAMVLRRIVLGHEWRKHECVLAAIAGIFAVVFIVMRFVDVLF